VNNSRKKAFVNPETRRTQNHEEIRREGEEETLRGSPDGKKTKTTLIGNEEIEIN